MLAVAAGLFLVPRGASSYSLPAFLFLGLLDSVVATARPVGYGHSLVWILINCLWLDT